MRRPNAQPLPGGIAGKLAAPADYFSVVFENVAVIQMKSFGTIDGQYEEVVLSFEKITKNYLKQIKGFPGGLAVAEYDLRLG